MVTGSDVTNKYLPIYVVDRLLGSPAETQIPSAWGETVCLFPSPMYLALV